VQTANQGRSSPPPLPPSDGALDGASCEQPAAVADDARYSLETRLIRTLLHAFGNPPIGFTLWNGDKIAPLGSAPAAARCCACAPIRICNSASFTAPARSTWTAASCA
jgi:hypothetical protein